MTAIHLLRTSSLHVSICSLALFCVFLYPVAANADCLPVGGRTGFDSKNNALQACLSVWFTCGLSLTPTESFYTCKKIGVSNKHEFHFEDPCVPFDPATGRCDPPPEFTGSIAGVPGTAAASDVLAVDLSIFIQSTLPSTETLATLYLSDDALFDPGIDDPLLILGATNPGDIFLSQPVVLPPDLTDGTHCLLWIVNPNEYAFFVSTGEPSLNELNISDNQSQQCFTVGVVPDTQLVVKKDPSDAVCVANPINVANGQKREAETDYEGSGPFPLTFRRWYNSALEEPWHFSYSSHLEFSANLIAVVLDSGQGLTFTMDAGVGSSDADVPGSLIDTGTGFVYLDENGTNHIYDINGRLISVTTRTGFSHSLAYTADQLSGVSDDFGNSLVFTTDVGGRISSMTTPNTEIYSYGYDTNGLLTSVTLPDETPADSLDNPNRQYLYESINWATGLTGVIDENGVRFSTFDYDTQGRAILSEHAGGVDRFQFNYAANSTTVTNPLGKNTTYHFESLLGNNRITQIEGLVSTNCEASNTLRTYDDHGYVASRTNRNGNITNLTYTHTGQDPAIPDFFVGLETSRIEAVGSAAERTVTTTWDTTHRLPASITEEGKTTLFNYDLSGRLILLTEEDTGTQTVPYSTNGNTRVWTYAYDGNGLLASIDGPRTDVADITSFSYTVSGDLASVTNALGHVTTIAARDSDGLPTTIVDANGVSTSLAYDAQRRLVLQTTGSVSGDVVTTFTYDKVDQVTSVVLPNGVQLNYEYDAARRLTAIQNNLGERLEFTLDNSGNRIVDVSRDALGSIVQSHQRAFDELSRMIRDLGASGQVTTLAYDLNDNPVGSIDTLNNSLIRAFDGLNRLASITDALLGVSNFEYDDRGNLTKVTDPRGIITEYTYDGLENLLQITSGDTGTAVFTYDAVGNQIGETRANGDVVTQSHDALNRLVNRAFSQNPAENMSFTYDAGGNGIGRLAGITDISGSLAYSYDDRGNLLQVDNLLAGTNYITGYTYDIADNITSITYPSGRIVSYARDVLGRISTITTQLSVGAPVRNVATNLDYQPFGPVNVWTHGNGLGTSLTYDQDYRLTGINVSDGTQVMARNHGYDLVDNLTSINDGVSGVNRQFDYDELYRLTDATSGTSDIDYSYDAVGNRLSNVQNEAGDITTETYTYDSTSSRLANVTTVATTNNTNTVYLYDANGNLVSRDTAGDVLDFVSNFNNRLTAVVDGGAIVAEYFQNALGQRVIKQATGQEQLHFHYDPAGQLLAESNDLGQVIREYIYLDNMLVGMIAAEDIIGSIPAPVVVDSEDAGVLFGGNWQTSTAAPGFLGSNYHYRAGVATPPGENEEDGTPGGGGNLPPDPDPDPGPLAFTITVSTNVQETLGGLLFTDGDLAEYDPALNTATLLLSEALFTGNENIDALHRQANGNIVLSMTGAGDIGGRVFTKGDLVEYDPLNNTASILFDGALAFGQTRDINAVAIRGNGNIVLSVSNDGVTTLGGIAFTKDDLVEFDPVTGTATLIFAGDLIFASSENIDAVSFDENGSLVISTMGAASISGVSFDKDDLVVFDSATGASIVFDGAASFTNTANIDAVHYGNAGSPGGTVQVVDEEIVVSTNLTELVDGITVTKDDLLLHTTLDNSSALLFDGSILLAGDSNINALHLLDNGHYILSFTNAGDINGRAYTKGDLVDLDPVNGTATIFLDGLAVFGEARNIDAVSILDNGNVVLSVGNTGSSQIAGVAFTQDDLVEYNPVLQTASILLGGNVAFGGNRDINGVYIDADGLISLTVTGAATLGGLTFSKEDIVRLDSTTNIATMLYDGSEHFATEANIMALHLGIPQAAILPAPINEAFVISTTTTETLAGVTAGSDDLLSYLTLDGTASLLLDGASVFGVSKDINGVQLLDDGQYLLSMSVNGSIGGVSFSPDDVVIYDPLTNVGSLLFEGTSLFGGTKNINALHQLANGHLLISVDNNTATLAGLTFSKGDLIEYDLTTGIASLYFDGDVRFGAGKNIDGIFVRENGHLVLTVASGNAMLGGMTFSNADIIDYDPAGDFAIRLFSEDSFDNAANIDALFVSSVVTMIDTDGDGVPDDVDAFPNDPNETTDSDGDGVGDNADIFPDDATASASVTWPIQVTAEGDYVVFARWTESDNRSTSAEYRIATGAITYSVIVDQTLNGGNWVVLGTFAFDPNEVTEITIIDSGDGFVIADAVKLEWASATGPIEQVHDLYYVHTDHLGTPQVITDAAQTIAWDADYKSFGEATVTTNRIENPVRFPGQYFDEETGLHYNYFRDYDPEIGRYIQSDPIGLLGGQNYFTYVLNNPQSNVDPFGLITWKGVLRLDFATLSRKMIPLLDVINRAEITLKTCDEDGKEIVQNLVLDVDEDLSQFIGVLSTETEFLIDDGLDGIVRNSLAGDFEVNLFEANLLGFGPNIGNVILNGRTAELGNAAAGFGIGVANLKGKAEAFVRMPR